jgi:DNA mismatch endonuclease (patch repair protein)
MDRITTEARSRIMAAVRGKDTTPERVVRSLLHRLGVRFRLHRKDLPGRPDIVLPARRMAIFVHGCFWHRHAGCKRTTSPASNREYWQAKFRANRARDRRNEKTLIALGWRVVVLWECETRDLDRLTRTLRALLRCASSNSSRASAASGSRRMR